VTEVKSPQVKIADAPAPRPAATTSAATPANKPTDEKSGKPSRFGSFVKDMGKATGKVAHQTLDPQGAERKELNAAAWRSFNRIDREDDFLLGLRLKYNELFTKAKQTTASAEKEQLRKEIAELAKKEEEIADVYRRIKAKHDLLDRQQNAINLAEDSIHFTSGKYAGGIKNILVTRANYVRMVKWPIHKSQWPELYFNRFACSPGEDCKAEYEKLAKRNYEVVERSQQAKDEDLKLVSRPKTSICRAPAKNCASRTSARRRHSPSINRTALVGWRRRLKVCASIVRGSLYGKRIARWIP
jgi:hypothetical protein